METAAKYIQGQDRNGAVLMDRCEIWKQQTRAMSRTASSLTVLLGGQGQVTL